jgi:hypothetical protein
MCPKRFPSLWDDWRKPCTNFASKVALSPNRLNWSSTWTSSPRCTIECVQNDFYVYGMVRSVQTARLSSTDTNTVSDQTKIKFHMTHVTYEFHQVRPKLFMSLWYVQCKPCNYLVLRLALSPNRPNRAPPDPRHLGVASGVCKTSYEPMVPLTQTEHLSCTDSNTVSKHIETRFHMTHVT